MADRPAGIRPKGKQRRRRIIGGGGFRAGPSFVTINLLERRADLLGGGRNILRGPSWVNLDFSLFRRFLIREKVSLEFRSEFFNFTNTPHFDWPSGTSGLASDATVTRAGHPAFAQITATNENAPQRVIRFGLRLLF